MPCSVSDVQTSNAYSKNNTDVSTIKSETQSSMDQFSIEQNSGVIKENNGIETLMIENLLTLQHHFHNHRPNVTAPLIVNFLGTQI